MKIQLIWIILALLCAFYGILIFGTGSGTGFFLVWFAAAAGFLMLFFFSRAQLWLRLPFPVRTAIAVLLCVLCAVFLLTEFRIIRAFGGRPEKDLDYLIVLGAQVRESGPSVVLKYRLDTAAEYLKENPETLCVVSGGRGYNEPFSEAEGMKRYLVQCGIEEGRILMEPESKNTQQNFEYTLALIGKDHGAVGIVTNDFHMYRALKIAGRAGIKGACPVTAPSSLLYLPNNLLREFLALIAGMIRDIL